MKNYNTTPHGSIKKNEALSSIQNPVGRRQSIPCSLFAHGFSEPFLHYRFYILQERGTFFLKELIDIWKVQPGPPNRGRGLPPMSLSPETASSPPRSSLVPVPNIFGWIILYLMLVSFLNILVIFEPWPKGRSNGETKRGAAALRLWHQQTPGLQEASVRSRSAASMAAALSGMNLPLITFTASSLASHPVSLLPFTRFPTQQVAGRRERRKGGCRSFREG